MAVQGITMPAPYGGLDLVSPIDNMEPFHALELINIFPSSNAPTLRKGYVEFQDTGNANPVRTLSAMPLPDGNSKLIAAVGTKIYAIDSAGVTDTGATITNSNCQTEIFNNKMFICNGADTVQVYDGSTLTIGNSTFTGVTLADLINVSSYKNRLYFIEKDSANIWYGGVNAVGSSALTQEDLSYVLRLGGFLVFAGSFTNQTAQTSADLFLVISSEGEVLCYAGDDPSSWTLVARFYIGKPLGYKAFVRVNQDLWIITEQGIVPVSGLFKSDPQQASESVSRRVNPLISQAARGLAFSNRWQGVFYPQGRRVYVQVPISSVKAYLLVYSIDTGGWTKFHQHDDGDCLSIAVNDGVPFYGSDLGVIYEAEQGYNDKSEEIEWKIETPFSFYGSRGNYKTFKDIRPLVKTVRGTGFSIGLSTDFRRISPYETVTTSSGGFYTPWSVAGSTSGQLGFTAWGSRWSTGTDYIYDRFAAKGQGHCASVTLAGNYKDKSLEIFGFEIRFDVGGQV
jgi:hypothetical protein